MKIKRLYVLFFVLGMFFLSSCNSSLNPLRGKETTGLYPIRQNNKNGYINRQGEVVIPPQFEFTLPFSEGLAAVCTSAGKCGFIDETGKFVINPQFQSVYRFSEGLAAVVTEGRLGYIDKTGKYVINPQFNSSGGPRGEGTFATFSEGLACVKIGEKYGFIDKTGKIVINPQFENATPFFEGLAATKTGEKWGFVDKDGKIVINPQFELALPFANGLAAVLIGKQYGYIDKTGKIVINPQFDSVLPFSDEGIAAVALNQKTGFIDKEGKYIVNPQFGMARNFNEMESAFLITSDLGRLSFSEGLAPVQIGDKEGSLGYADKTGKIIINPQFSEALPFYGGLALVVFGGNGGPGGDMAWIDKEGKIVWRETRETPKPAANPSVMTDSSSSAPTSNTATNTMPAPSGRTGRLTTDSNLRSEASKDAASLGIHFKGAKISVLDEKSFTRDGELSTWYKVKITEYGCSVDTNLGCGKNSPNDADEGWINGKNVLLD
jgi:hypothetical protein